MIQRRGGTTLSVDKPSFAIRAARICFMASAVLLLEGISVVYAWWKLVLASNVNPSAADSAERVRLAGLSIPRSDGVGGFGGFISSLICALHLRSSLRSQFVPNLIVLLPAFRRRAFQSSKGRPKTNNKLRAKKIVKTRKTRENARYEVKLKCCILI